MIGEHYETRIEMPNMCPFEKKEKEFFLDYQFFFSGTKKKFQETTFVKFFMYCKAKKKFGVIQRKRFQKFT